MSPILQVNGVTKRFRRGDETVTALDTVSLCIEKNQFVALVGPSGSGKSTLLNLLARFDLPNEGKICIAGIDIGSVSDDALDHFRNITLGFIFQQFNLVKVLSALENVELAMLPQKLSRKERRKRALVMLEAVGLSHRIHHRADEMSGGQQQRVAIARALVNRPMMLLADEPTGNLDGQTSVAILELLVRMQREIGTTIIVATHDQRVVDIADRVVHMEDGSIAQ